MSCMDVVYQPLQRHPFYQHPRNKNSGNDNEAGHSLASVKVEEDQSESGSDKDSFPEAEYVSAKCVIFTYFTGDTNKVVDDHFTKALNQPSSFTSDVVEPTTTGKQSIIADRNNNNKGSLMSQRAFPPSFWSSNYYNMGRNNGHSDLPTSIQEMMFGDACNGSSSNRPDVWQYSLAQSAYTHRPITELGYGVSSSNTAVFNPRYSSLLIQPPVRPSRLPSFQAPCEPSDPGWSIAYTNPNSSDYSSYALDNAATTSMAENQDSNKDSFWF
ncbi:transcription cofactor vestigial-like protein 2 isoform X2 [Anneissia japonica]|uniref:transcription cofactor vestigial-like protein 2 isoform X2 n=1 Tax=Anneissia japonica TaxID=1529436 RepID=UPI0014258B54|nr:transcription cofactor vestigial-like protein 2 isoform X2 [Anneissia japonica]